jgi:hypothetical protein
MYSQYHVPSFFAFIFVFQLMQAFWIALQDLDWTLPLTDLKLATPVINFGLAFMAFVMELIRPGPASDYVVVDGRAVFLFSSLKIARIRCHADVSHRCRVNDDPRSCLTLRLHGSIPS